MPHVIEKLTELLQHRRTGDSENDDILDAIIGGLADVAEPPALVAFGDEATGARGEQVLRDPRYAPIWALAHAAMYTGAALPGRAAGETEAAWLTRARDQAVYPLGIKRGTQEAIRRAVQPLLTGTKAVFITEFVGGDPYQIQVRTIVSETPDPAAVQAAIEGDFVSSGRRGAIRAELKLTYTSSDDPTFAEGTRAMSAVANGITALNVTRGDVT